MEPWREVGAHNGSVEALNEAQKGCRPGVTDSHHLHLSEKSDPDPHFSEKMHPDPHQSEVDQQPCFHVCCV
jgi:hypothetical protein